MSALAQNGHPSGEKNGTDGFVPDPAFETYPPACLLSGDRFAIRLVHSLGQFFGLYDVFYLNGSDADTPFAAAMRLGPLNNLV